ncbi:putative glycolipid-binding domain-containing protein [Labrys okinawensis]|uniref:putative glycolipid-binding domain-containing protein n=1 Tax=Labrys okinawensis TaxID=346911 RepID=UPI0039BD0EF7
MSEFAFWRRLDAPGHDMAALTVRPGGWFLQGHAAFHETGDPTGLCYEVELDERWHSLSGRVQGFRGLQRFDHVIRHEAGGWSLDGRIVDGLNHLADLDFGFTPATNMPQLRRLALEIGQSVKFTVVWFDVGMGTLAALPQIYRRESETTYWYESPTSAFEGLIDLAPSGFARIYPTLWQEEVSG